jgi:hypothetical protein
MSATMAELSGAAKRRGFFMDHTRKEWTKWEEVDNIALCTFINRKMEVWVATYGPEYRFGYFSLLEEVRVANMDEAERYVDAFFEGLRHHGVIGERDE